MFVLTLVYFGHTYMYPENYDGLGEILVESYNDVVVWGKEKIAFNYTKDISNRTITYENLKEQEKEIENENEEVEIEKNFEKTSEI
jgi:hypothetical protein